MKILIKQARIVDPLSPFNGQTTDILIENGVISRIAKKITEKANQVIEADNLHASPGWVDIFSNFADPGYEHKETLETGAAAAAAGGYTDVLVIPNTKPVIHDKAGVEYIKQKSKRLPVNIHPIGAVTKNTAGQELAEMYDMKASGAVAFSDGLNTLQQAGLLVKALQYIKAFNGTILQLPDDKTINPQGLMNEGIISTQMGLPGKPAMAEELVVARDIKLALYTESKLHFTAVTTKKSLEYIKKGKDSGTSVSCSVTPYHLFFCDEDLAGYDTYLKVNPPLRSRVEKDALKKAVEEGMVDCFASHHLPHEYDSKVIEFEYAQYGMIGLETAFAVIRTSLPALHIDKLVEMLAINPRRLFGLPEITVAENTTASITLFNPSAKWTVSENDIRSKSKNSAFIGKELTGKVLGTVNGHSVILQ